MHEQLSQAFIASGLPIRLVCLAHQSGWPYRAVCYSIRDEPPEYALLDPAEIADPRYLADWIASLFDPIPDRDQADAAAPVREAV